MEILHVETGSPFVWICGECRKDGNDNKVGRIVNKFSEHHTKVVDRTLFGGIVLYELLVLGECCGYFLNSSSCKVDFGNVGPIPIWRFLQ